ncbi:MAG: hypothetical protein GY796_33585 [Chloroflexi bacterium]|nr:hypothetical protein [Chloroflexota bacterium]
MPFEDFTRSAEQPVNVPDDGLTLSEVWGYGFQLPDSANRQFYLDRVYLELDIIDAAYILYLPITMKP